MSKWWFCFLCYGTCLYRRFSLVTRRRTYFRSFIWVIQTCFFSNDFPPLYYVVLLFMVPVFIVAFRWVLGGGLISGFLFRLLNLVFGPTILHLYQAFIEYGFAFTFIGLAGIFSNTIKDALRNEQAGKAFTYITFGTLLGSGLRFLAHFYGGIVFWGEFAPEDQPVWLYSLVYNGSYMLPSFVICAVGIYLLFKAHPRLLLR